MGDLWVTAAYSVLALFVAKLVSKWLSSNGASKRRGLPYPPGPKPDLLIGNMRHLPMHEPWLRYIEMAKIYGKIMHFEMLGRHIVVINSLETIMELLSKRAAIYSGRPQMPMASELMGWQQVTPFADYGDIWRKHRKLSHTHLNKIIATEYNPLHEKVARFYLKCLLDHPEKFREDHRLAAGKAILSLTYGIDPQTTEDPFVTAPEEAMAELSKSVIPGKWLVDTIPALKHVPEWFPGAYFKRYAKTQMELVDRMAASPFESVKKAMAAGTAVPSIVSKHLHEIEGDKEEENVLKWAAATMYLAGADTTVSSVGSFFLAMTRHPESFKKAQEELDRVVGTERLPTFEDRPNLPYVEAVMKEVLRWHPVLPLGFLHKTVQEDVYDGYYIPNETTVFPNIWGVTRNEDEYTDANAFNPDRYFIPNKLGHLPVDPTTYVFGFGRRICPGMHFADASLFIILVCVIATFDIEREVDEEGREIVPPEAYVNSMLSFPKTFKCRIRPRSKAAAALIENAFALDHDT
jgi:cytochrome P450